MKIRLDQKVKCGDEMFVDKKTQGVIYTAPASGTIKAINRGAKRKLLSVVIEVEGEEYKEFAKYDAAQLPSLSRKEVTDNIVAAGLWPCFRTRPMSKVPAIDSTPAAIFVSVMDTNPLAADPMVIIQPHMEDFNHGLTLLKHLTDGELFVGFDGAKNHDLAQNPAATYQAFSGIHPSGNVGTHIHFLKPVNESRTVWHLGYQDVIAIAGDNEPVDG